MIRYEWLDLLAPLITDHLIVTSQSGQRIEWNNLLNHDGNLLVGSMGNALGVGIGLATALPHRKVIVLESDGSVLLALFNLATLANVNPPNMKVFVFDNEAYSGTNQLPHRYGGKNRSRRHGPRSGNQSRGNGARHRRLQARRHRTT
jgi:sulfopyruvate decarboxylase subunit beta